MRGCFVLLLAAAVLRGPPLTFGQRGAGKSAKERWDRPIHYLENILPR